MLGLGNQISQGSVLGFSNLDAIDFDGIDEYLIKDVTNFRSSDTQGTLAAWIKTTATTGTIFSSSDVIADDYHFQFGVYQSKLNIWLQNGGSSMQVQSNSTVNSGSWTFVALSSNGTRHQMYINGGSLTALFINTASGEWLGDIIDRDNITIGALKRAIFADYFDGTIDEVGIWSVELSTSELNAVYNSGEPIALDSNTKDYGQSSNLVGWWRMGDGTENGDVATIYDMSGGGNDLTSYNMDSNNITTDVPV